MNFITSRLIKLGILMDDLDYHVVRASMVVIFFFFGYQKWFNYEAQALIPLYQPRTSDLLDVPCLRHSGSHMVLGRC
jgi:uncharacterized membrane protein YkgB